VSEYFTIAWEYLRIALEATPGYAENFMISAYYSLGILFAYGSV